VTGHSSLLKPVGPKTYNPVLETLEFDAELLRDFAGDRAGATVQVTLDLFGRDPDSNSEGRIIVDSETSETKYWWMPLQQLLGRTVTNAAVLSLDAFLDTVLSQGRVPRHCLESRSSVIAGGRGVDWAPPAPLLRPLVWLWIIHSAATVWIPRIPRLCAHFLPEVPLTTPASYKHSFESIPVGRPLDSVLA
jgi:hypothetical protein